MNTVAEKNVKLTGLKLHQSERKLTLPARPVVPLPNHHHALSKPEPGIQDVKSVRDVTRDTQQDLDRLAHASIGHLTAGISPASIMSAFTDWAWHLTISPGKQGQLLEKAWRKSMRFASYLSETIYGGRCEPCIEPLSHDERFRGAAWQTWPFNFIYQSFLLTQQWWDNATTNMAGVSSHHLEVVNFTTRQLLDMYAPANYPATNPEVINQTIKTAGLNFLRGFSNWLQDVHRVVNREAPVGTEDFLPGKAVALTPGKVVYRNRLIELIQYAPGTDSVEAQPVLIVPAWIMKYYILDLSPENSLVRWLVEQGHTVFMISWKNPDRDDRDLGLDDYRRYGIMEALNVINTILPNRKIHAAGYCLGGTLLSIAAAAMGRDNDDRFADITLFASLTDFSEAGELEMFIDESQVDFLEDLMWETGYLESWQMKSTFQFLRSNDLIWSHLVHDYMMGERPPMIDMMAWSTDATRMPYRMHSEYLRRLYLRNELAEDNLKIEGAVIALRDIKLPAFVVGTRSDHIAPWQSVYKIHALTDGDVTFVLTSGGHNAGVVSEPGHGRRFYQIADKAADAPYVGPGEWCGQVEERQGSWWPEWHAWLMERSSGPVEPPSMGNSSRGFPPLDDAPGRYVLQR